MEDGASHPTNRSGCYIRKPRVVQTHFSPEFIKNSSDIHASWRIQFRSSLDQGMDQPAPHSSVPVVPHSTAQNFLEMFL